MSISQPQYEKLDFYYEYFTKWDKKTAEIQNQREVRTKEIQSILSKEKINDLTEDEINRAFGRLWTVNSRFQKALTKNNNIKKIRDTLKYLLYNETENEHVRLEKVNHDSDYRLKSFSESRTSEMLARVRPEYGIPLINESIRTLAKKLNLHVDHESSLAEQSKVYALLTKKIQEKYHFKNLDEIQLFIWFIDNFSKEFPNVEESLRITDGKKDGNHMNEVFEELLEVKNQVIFYGPPGTGKTYHARKFSENLVKANMRQKNEDEPKSKNRNAWFEYLKQKLKESIPKNYSISNPADGSKKTDVRISLESTDDEKRIAISYDNVKQNNEKKHVDVGIHEATVKWLSRVPKENRFVLVVNLSNSSYVLLPYDILIKNAKFRGGKLWDESGETKMWFTLTSLTENNAILSANNPTGKFDCKKFLFNLDKIFVSDCEFVTFHPSYSYEEFMEGIRARITDSNLEYYIDDGIFKRTCNAARQKRNENCKYVIIIDEINRGNISKIFGELITIIEKDKREKITTTLTYSKEKFTVPENVYIIGTMNTADRSLTQVDVALRRRFSFREFLPDYDLIDAEIEGIPLADLLKNLNERLRGEGLREKQIGHAYFMKEENPIGELRHVRHIFANEIIPLLQDYFYEDYEKIEKIIGSTFINGKSMSINQDWKDKNDEFVKGLREICKPLKQSN